MERVKEKVTDVRDILLYSPSSIQDFEDYMMPHGQFKEFQIPDKVSKTELIGRTTILRGATPIKGSSSSNRNIIVKQPQFSNDADPSFLKLRALRLSDRTVQFDQVGPKSFVDIVTGEKVDFGDNILPMGSVVVAEDESVIKPSDEAVFGHGTAGRWLRSTLH